MSNCSANSPNFYINTFTTIFGYISNMNIGNINTQHYNIVIYIFTISVF